MRCAKLLEAREQIASQVESEGRNELLFQEHVRAGVDEELRVARACLNRGPARSRLMRRLWVPRATVTRQSQQV